MRKISEARKQELVKTCPIIYREIVSGGYKKLNELIEQHDDYVDFAFDHGFAEDAIKKNNIKALKLLLDAGVHPDTRRDLGPFGRTLLEEAIDSRAYNSVTFLLDAGADVNYTYNGKRASPLVCAASDGDLKLVKLFLERGADLHYTYGGAEKLSALKLAVRYDHHEVADYLRSQGAVMPEEEDIPPRDPSDEVIEALSGYFKGKPEPLGVGEIVPASVPLTVRIFPPVEGKRNSTVFMTSGLIEYALVVPKNKNKYRFAEYFIEMPGTWSVEGDDLYQEKNVWPIIWLKAIGRYPHEQETYYDEKTTVTSVMIPELTTPDDKYNSALVERCQDMTFRVTQDERLVIYYRITPK